MVGDGLFKVMIGNKVGFDVVVFDGKLVDLVKYLVVWGNVVWFMLF